MVDYSEIPRSVTLQNLTFYPQRIESYTVPAGTDDENGMFVPGELVIDLSQIEGYRKERIWVACNNAHGGLSMKIKGTTSPAN
jgi:hypothetical protein